MYTFRKQYWFYPITFILYITSVKFNFFSLDPEEVNSSVLSNQSIVRLLDTFVYSKVNNIEIFRRSFQWCVNETKGTVGSWKIFEWKIDINKTSNRKYRNVKVKVSWDVKNYKNLFSHFIKTSWNFKNCIKGLFSDKTF